MMGIQIDTAQTPEKYICYKDKILPWFIDMMQEYEAQISPLMKKLNELYKCNQRGQYSDEIGRLTEESKALKSEILSEHISESIFVSSFDSSPTRFCYFTAECSLKFIMKTSKKASVIAKTNDKYGSDVWHKFEFRPNDEIWKLDKMYLSYESENGPFKRFDF